MRIREHHEFGHGLAPGTDEDINCNACKAEKALGITPNITEPQTRAGLRAAARQAASEANELDWPPGKKFGELTPEQKRAAVERAAAQFQAELTASADSISHILDEAENPEYTVDVWTPDTYESERTGDDGPERDSSAGA